MAKTSHQAPHRDVPATTEKERFTLRLFDDLWARYRVRVAYVRAYESVIRFHGATFVNDHIAFRTIARQFPGTGLFTLSRIFQALGYAPQACYEFPDKHLSAVHLQHPNRRFPKLFISELKTWELTRRGRAAIDASFKRLRPAPSDKVIEDLWNLQGLSSSRRAALLKSLIEFFGNLPWPPPRKWDVLALGKETQYGAWVLLNGYDVNHFTALVNSHGAPALAGIEKTVAELLKAGVPMKEEIEGARGSMLRQSSTASVVLPFRVRGKNGLETLDWTYAYFEIAERGCVRDPRTGKSELFEGFLGAQATQLFDMTKVK